MTQSQWQYTSESRKVVSKTETNGVITSILISAPEIQEWISEGNTPLDPPSPTPTEASALLIAQAQALLDKSDITCVRCFSADPPVAVPSAWASYRTALRLIVKNGTGIIPAIPSYPVGT